MFKARSGTSNYYKGLCAVVFILFSFVYLYCYQTDVLAAAQHVASGGRTHYEPMLGTLLIVLALKLLQNGIQAIARLKRIFYALTYLPSFLLLAFITDIPSKPIKEITFGAWSWVLPLVLIVWILLVFAARQYQPVEVNARGGGLLSQITGINLTLFLALMLMTCLIGNHNRLFHQQMHVENLISHKNFEEAQKAAENYNTNNHNILILRAYALAQRRKIGDELFKMPMIGISSIMPSSAGFYSVIIPTDNLMEYYKRNADWQLCEMLIKKDVDEFYDNLVFFYGLDDSGAAPDSSAVKAKPVKAVAKLNAYKDSLMSIRYHSLPQHYKEALVLYNFINSGKNSPRKTIKENYLDKDLVVAFKDFQKGPANIRERRFSNTYWQFYCLKQR